MKWVKPNHHARPDLIRVIVHQIVDRRGRHRFLTTMAGRAICVSRNPIICTAEALLAAGYDLSTSVTFCDASNDLEEAMTLAEAIEERLPGLGSVVPFRKAVRR